MLLFDEESHSYQWDGEKIPSVTSILKPLNTYAGVPERILQAKAELGKNVHLCCELHDQDDLDMDSVSDEYMPYLQAWIDFKNKCQPEWLGMEARVFNKTFRYAGTFDRLARINGKTVLIDIKTTLNLMPTLPLQLAAYAHCLDQLPDVCAGVQLKPDGTYHIVKYGPKEGWAEFLSLLTLRSFSVKHKLKNTFTL